jgi:glycosyltransferase involved in cell wall biosynthesis
MRVLHVIRDLSPNTGGPVSAVLNMAEAQSRLGHQVTIAATGLDQKALRSGAQIETYACQLSAWNMSYGLMRGLRRLIPDSDIVHLHTMWEFPIWISSKISNLHKKPYILRPCGMLDEWSLLQGRQKKSAYLRLLGNSIIRRAAAVHFTSEGELEKALPLARENSFVLPIGLPAAAFSYGTGAHEFMQRWPGLEGKRLVLYLGRLHPKKQPEVVIRAFGSVAAEWQDVHLILAGPADKQYLTALVELVENSGLSARVTFTGPLEGDEITAAYRAAYCFVLPSLQENFGIAVAEAMAAGCPVIVSDRVDLCTLIREENAGLVCTVDVESVVKALRTMISIPSLRDTCSRNARRLALEKLTWDKLCSQLMAIYEDILAGKKSQSSWRL